MGRGQVGRGTGGHVDRWAGEQVDRWAGRQVGRWIGGQVDRWAGEQRTVEQVSRSAGGQAEKVWIPLSRAYRLTIKAYAKTRIAGTPAHQIRDERRCVK